MPIMKITCWNCGHTNNLCLAPEDPTAMPENGDIAMCCQCGNLAIIDDSREENARKPSPSERDEIMSNIEAFKMVLWWERQRGLQK